MTVEAVGLFDAAIRKTPEQWFWYNKRWVLDPVDPEVAAEAAPLAPRLFTDRTPPEPASEPEPTPKPAPEPAPEPVPEPTTEPTPEPMSEPSSEPALAPRPSPGHPRSRKKKSKSGKKYRR